MKMARNAIDDSGSGKARSGIAYRKEKMADFIGYEYSTSSWKKEQRSMVLVL